MFRVLLAGITRRQKLWKPAMQLQPSASVCVLCPLAVQPSQSKWHTLNNELLQAAGIDRKWRGFRVCDAHFSELRDKSGTPTADLSQDLAGDAMDDELSRKRLANASDLPVSDAKIAKTAYTVKRAITGLQSGVLGGVPPIGYIESCFPERNGTPRQGMLAPATVARLTITAEPSPAKMVEGLDGFSHVWLLFVFHINENMQIKPKVFPPRMGGESQGLFATRTPHRPVPIGLSIARLERVEGATLHLTGVDLLHGTPVLDVKPYVPYCDSVPDARAPDWVSVQTNAPLRVQFDDVVDSQLAECESRLRFFRSWRDCRLAIEQVVALDIRSQQMKKQSARDPRIQFGFCIDTLNVLYSVDKDVAFVRAVELWRNFDDQKPAASADTAAAAAALE